MLFTTTEISKARRLQGSFVSDNEIKKIVNYIKEKGGEPDYVEEILEKQKVRGLAGVGMDGSGVDDDNLLQEAKEIIINSGKASASYLQRRLSIGYARAARLLDLLEQEGIIGQANGSKPREILISQEQYDKMINQTISGMPLHKQKESEAPDEYLEEVDDESEKTEDEIEPDLIFENKEDKIDDDEDDGKYFSK